MAGDEIRDAAAPQGAAVAPVAEAGPGRDGRWSWPKRLAIGFGSLLALLVALVAVALVAIDTDPGRRFAARQIERLAFENGIKIGIRRIDGSLYGAMVLRGLTVSDPRGVFVRSPEVRVDWRPFAYLKSHVDVRSLAAGLVVLERLPAFRPTASTEPLLPDLDIDVGRLTIDRLVFQPPVTGEQRAASVAGRAHIADRRAQVVLDGRTLAGKGGAAGDRLALRLDAVPERNRLDLDVTLDAPAGGVLASLTGVREAVSLRLRGAGDWARWDGRLAADLGGQDFARLTLAARDGTISVRGNARPARLVAGPTAALLGRATGIDVTAAIDRRRVNLQGVVFSDVMHLAANGGLDLSDNTFDGLRLAFVLGRPAVLAPNLAGRDLRARMTLDGAFARPKVAYQLSAGQLAMNGIGIENLRASGAARVDADRIVVPVAARASRITGLNAAAGGTLADIRLDGDVAIDGPRILSDNMRIRSNRIDAKLILVADASAGFYSGAIDGRVENYRIESVGLFDFETDADLKSAKGGGFALSGSVRARSKSLFNEGVRDFLGGNVVASTDVSYGPDGRIRFVNLRAAAPAVRVTNGRGSYLPGGQIEVVADGYSTRYGRVGVELAGTVARPLATVTAERPGLGVGLAGLRARITGTEGGYRLAAVASTDYGPLSADVTMGVGRGPLALTIHNADLGGVGFSGRLRQTAAGPFSGRLDARGQGLGGVVRLGAAGRFQEAVINLRANGTVLPGPANLAIGGAIVDARVVLYDRPYVVADAQVAQTRVGSLNLNAARVIVDYRNGRGQAKLFAEGVSGVPFRIAANAELEPHLWRAAVRGRVRGIEFSTSSPARIIPRAAGYELLPTRVGFGQGNVRLAGTYGPGLTIQSRLDSLDMSFLNAFAPGLGLGGRASGSLDFAQPSPGAFPRADARLTINGFTRTTAGAVSQPVDINVLGRLFPEGGDARAVVRRRGAVIGRMLASLRPLPPGSGAWSTRLMGAPLAGGIRYNGPADTLFSFAGMTDQRLSGPVGVAADFSGRVAQPRLAGIVRANALTYENQTYGTRLTNLAVHGRFTGDRLEIERLAATAGSGSLSGRGYISLASASGYPMDFRIDLDNARLARSDSLSAAATGQLALTKAAGQTALLSGTIRLPETRYQVVRQGSAQIPELTGVRFKPPRGRPRITGDEPTAPAPGLFQIMRLDLTVAAPRRLFVSGMGLESEWSADLRVGGTSAEPRVSGSVELVRGTLGFAGRSFELGAGEVQFTGGRTIDPLITLVASEEIEDVTVNVNVRGRAMNPQITFSSTPGLPQDEILSRILFGSSLGNLSAIQAVQLAASLNSLRGSGGGLNPLGKLRSAAGIDRLRLLGPDEASGRGTALAAGQYISDDIYVEIVTDARGFTATQLEVSLTPALSVLSQAGGSGVSNVNVRYKKNY